MTTTYQESSDQAMRILSEANGLIEESDWNRIVRNNEPIKILWNELPPNPYSDTLNHITPEQRDKLLYGDWDYL